MFALQSDHPHPAGAGLELTYACTDKVSRFFGPVCWLDVDCAFAADHPQRTGRTAAMAETWENAAISAVGECVERYCCAVQPPDLIFASAAELGARAYPLET